jgi:DNA-binding GntR family transcriptional regulator
VTPAEVPARFETKSEWVYARLRERITGGELRSGERLRLADLALEFDTSVMPVREALRLLQREGLVEMASHRGASVARVTWERVVEAVMIRMHLEALAAREATSYHDEASLAAIEEQLDRMDAAAQRRRPTEYSEANRRFHTIVEEACPYPLLKQEIQQLWDAMWRTRSRSLFRLSPGRMAEARGEHRAIADALRARDADSVAAWSEEHMRTTVDAWRLVAKADLPLD